MAERVKLDNVPTAVSHRVYAFLDAITEIRLMRPSGDPSPQWNSFCARSMPINFGDALREGLRTNRDGRSANRRANIAFRHMLMLARRGGREEALETVKRLAVDEAYQAANRALAAAGYDKYPMSDRMAGAAATDAGILASARLMEDIGNGETPMHISNAAARWSVWNRGFALAVEVNGALFVAGDSAPAFDGVVAHLDERSLIPAGYR